jgi:hypothetical protein
MKALRSLHLFTMTVPVPVQCFGACQFLWGTINIRDAADIRPDNPALYPLSGRIPDLICRIPDTGTENGWIPGRMSG